MSNRAPKKRQEEAEKIVCRTLSLKQVKKERREAQQTFRDSPCHATLLVRTKQQLKKGLLPCLTFVLSHQYDPEWKSIA